MTRYDKKTDNNQKEIVAEFRRLGWEVIDTHCLGGGFPDVVVVMEGFVGGETDYGHYQYDIRLVEIKNGNAPYSKAEIEFIEKYPGLVTTVRSVEQVKELFG
jgi:hypothetical protein